jgi:hypothetical protein
MAVKGATRLHRQRREAAEARAEAQAAHEEGLSSDDGSDSDDERVAQPGIKMNLQDLVDMGKADLSDLPHGADAVPVMADGRVRRWPTANENHTTITEGQIHFLPAQAADFDEKSEIGEAARTKFQLSVAASLGITPECVKITDVRDVSFLEAVQELGRREEQEELLAGLDDKEEAEEELYELQMKHGKSRFKQAVKKWRRRENSSGDLKLGRVRRRKEKLERLLDSMELEHNGMRPRISLLTSRCSFPLPVLRCKTVSLSLSLSLSLFVPARSWEAGRIGFRPGAAPFHRQHHRPRAAPTGLQAQSSPRAWQRRWWRRDSLRCIASGARWRRGGGACGSEAVIGESIRSIRGAVEGQARVRSEAKGDRGARKVHLPPPVRAYYLSYYQ